MHPDVEEFEDLWATVRALDEEWERTKGGSAQITVSFDQGAIGRRTVTGAIAFACADKEQYRAEFVIEDNQGPKVRWFDWIGGPYDPAHIADAGLRIRQVADAYFKGCNPQILITRGMTDPKSA